MPYKILRILLYGTALDPELENRLLYDEYLSQYVECVMTEFHESKALNMIEAENLNTVFVDPAGNSDDSVRAVLKFIEKTRTRFPGKVVFLLYTNKNLAKEKIQKLDPTFPFDRYISANNETVQDHDYFKGLQNALRKCRSYVAPSVQQREQEKVPEKPSNNHLKAANPIVLSVRDLPKNKLPIFQYENRIKFSNTLPR